MWHHGSIFQYHGKKVHVFRLDCRNLEFEYFPLELGEYQLLLLDTRVEHALEETAYNDRRSQCEEGVAILKKQYPEIQNLRDLSPEQLTKHKACLSEIVYQRCLYVVNEYERVHKASQTMLNEGFTVLGNLIYHSRDSLSSLYEVSCKELDFLVDYTRDLDYVLGARMMGGGFDGCTLNLIANEYDARPWIKDLFDS